MLSTDISFQTCSTTMAEEERFLGPVQENKDSKGVTGEADVSTTVKEDRELTRLEWPDDDDTMDGETSSEFSASPCQDEKSTEIEAATSSEPTQRPTSSSSRPGKVFSCSRCSYETDRKNNLKRHITTMHDPAPSVLDCCGTRFSTKGELREHTRAAHGAGYTCWQCGHTFCRRALLHRHQSVHSGHKAFSCSKCGYQSSHKSNMQRHMQVHSHSRNIHASRFKEKTKFNLKSSSSVRLQQPSVKVNDKLSSNVFKTDRPLEFFPREHSLTHFPLSYFKSSLPATSDNSLNIFNSLRNQQSVTNTPFTEALKTMRSLNLDKVSSSFQQNQTVIPLELQRHNPDFWSMGQNLKTVPQSNSFAPSNVFISPSQLEAHHSPIPTKSIGHFHSVLEVSASSHPFHVLPKPVPTYRRFHTDFSVNSLLASSVNTSSIGKHKCQNYVMKDLVNSYHKNFYLEAR